MKKDLYPNIEQLIGQIPSSIVKIDVDSEWRRFRRKNIHERPSFRAIYYYVSAAAILLLFFAIWALTPGTKIYSAQDKPLDITLADNSHVRLAPGAVLTVQNGFNHLWRKVNLEGTAVFQVEHNKMKPFWVHAGQLKVRVKGTKFVVSTESKQVAVIDGIVEVKSFGKKVELHKGQSIKLQGNTLTVSNKLEPELVWWQSRKLVFSNQKLADIVQTLVSVYNQPIELSPEVANLRLTVTFENQDLDSVLQIIAETLDLKLSRKGAVRVLSK